MQSKKTGKNFNLAILFEIDDENDENLFLNNFGFNNKILQSLGKDQNLNLENSFNLKEVLNILFV